MGNQTWLTLKHEKTDSINKKLNISAKLKEKKLTALIINCLFREYKTKLHYWLS